jgi:hypothetical protein
MHEETRVDLGNLLVIAHTNALFWLQEDNNILLVPEVENFPSGWWERVPGRNDLKPILYIAKLEHVVV